MQLPDLYYLERYRNKKTRTYSKHASFTEAQPAYQPESDAEQFQLKQFELPRPEVNIYTANPSAELASRFISEGYVRFCIHPQVMEQFTDDSYLAPLLASGIEPDELPVVPSSSTRTLFVKDEALPHAVKVHFPFRVSRYTRKMRDEVVEQAIRVSEELESGIDKMGDDFAFLREVIGITFRDNGQSRERPENWGFVVRDMQPFPLAQGARSLVPGFSLYGEDLFDQDTKPLLCALIGDAEPVQYLLDNIILPIMRHWLDCFRHFGYLLEPHGQNALLEVDEQMQIHRIVHRDLSVGIDMRRRRDIGLADGLLNSYNRMEDSAFHCITFDRFMGSHFFDRLIQCCMEHYSGLCESDFTLPCQRAFAEYFPEYRDYLPKTVWYFSEQRDQYNKPLHQDTGESPKWRPAD